MIQLFASDMDGTILKDHLTIHPDNVAAVHDLQQRGYHFLICTGRDYIQATLCTKPANITCPIIAHNGAIVYDEQGQVLWEVTLTHEETRELVLELERHNLDWQVMTSNGIFARNYEQRFMKRIQQLREDHPHMTQSDFEIEVAKLRELLHAKDVASIDDVLVDDTVAVYKITSAVADDASGEEFAPIKAYIATHNPNLVVTSSYRTNIEINHHDAQKGLAIERYAHTLGLTMDNVFAIGDNGNDVSMIRMAAYGVAMGNANADAMAAAKYHTTTNEEGGVAKAIYQCLADNGQA